MKAKEFKAYLESMNPEVIVNSRLQGYGDYETPEQGIPLRGPEGVWEFCTTINTSWGYRPSDNDYKTSKQIIRMFCDCLTLGGKMLLDVGPKEDGTLDERQVKILEDLGTFIHDNEEAIYETEKGISYDHSLEEVLCQQIKKCFICLFMTNLRKISSVERELKLLVKK